MVKIRNGVGRTLNVVMMLSRLILSLIVQVMLLSRLILSLIYHVMLSLIYHVMLLSRLIFGLIYHVMFIVSTYCLTDCSRHVQLNLILAIDCSSANQFVYHIGQC